MKGKLTYKLISEIGVKEKYSRKEHYNSLKVWWARRPLSTMRALLVREILQREGETQYFADMTLFATINPPKHAFDTFKLEYGTDKLSVLDVFAGGGSIPIESARLGFKTISAELNPVASLLQETIFDSLPIEGYAGKLRAAGHRVIDRVDERIRKYYSVLGIEPYVTFWSKVAKCKSCNTDLDLRRIEYLSKRGNRSLKIIERNGELELISNADEGEKLQKDFVCNKCKTTHSFKDLKDFCKDNKFNHSAFAICYISGGKKYKIVSNEEKAILKRYACNLEGEIQNLSRLIPTESIKIKGGVINPTLYDLKKPQDFFNRRQLLVLLTTIDEIIREYPSLIAVHGLLEAKQIILGLTCLVEFLVDWNSVSTMWISQNEQSGRSLAGPGVGMKWDYIEINPFLNVGSNVRSKMDRVCDTFEAVHIDNAIDIIKGSSTTLPLKDATIDLVLTDPPYYDSIDYTGLSEFFRPWFEIILQNTFCEDADLKNDDQFEAIVELSKKSTKNHGHYETIMTGVLSEVRRVLKSTGSALMLYSHKTFEGWKVIADAFVASRLVVSNCIPIEMERIARPRAMAYDALNGVITFRLVKDALGITSVKEDISELKILIEKGEILDSQIVIYLAALAVKEVSLTDTSFESAYKQITKTYEKLRLENCLNNRMDAITKSYLEARLNDALVGLDFSQVEALEKNGLVLDARPKTLDEITLNDATRNTLLERAILIYKEFKFNHKTIILTDGVNRENLKAFYSVIGGLQLNTVAKRSNSLETKVARQVLSKLA